MNKGKLIVISGFSGVGKGTVVKRIIEKYNDCVVSVSATTREPREGEEHGIHYFFLSKDEFEGMISNDKLLEYAKYVDNYYGTPIDFVNDKLNNGINVILEIEMQGALEVKKKVNNAKLVFILPPSAEVLKNRLIGRGTETKEVISKRLSRAAEEVVFIDKYEYYVVNDNLEECVEDIRSIIDDRFADKLESTFVEQIKEEM